MIDKSLHKALTEVRPLPIRYTVEDLDFMPEDSNRYEIIEGELFVSRAPHFDHQVLIGNLLFQLQTYLQKNPMGMVVTTPGIIFSDEDAVIPDVVFAKHETIERSLAGKDERFDGKFTAAPELVVEIVSRGKKDIERDRIFKRELYAKHEVSEYWIVDGLYNSIEVYRLDDDGLNLIEKCYLNDAIESPLFEGFSLKLADIFRY